MLYHFRKYLFLFILFSFFLFLYLVYEEHISFFLPNLKDSDTLNIALFLLSALVQSLSAILGITVVAIFITAQISTRTKFTRILIEVYRNRTTFFTVSFFIITISICIFTIGYSNALVISKNYIFFNISILCSVTAVFFLIPLILVQIENINPYLLATKLSKQITLKRILKYKLVNTEIDSSTKLVKYNLATWGIRHGMDDPLGSFHEIVIIAVQNYDRIQLSFFIRLLVKKVANSCCAPYSLKLRHPKSITVFFHKIFSFLFLIFSRRRYIVDRIILAIHIFHYIVRRTYYLNFEWNKIDSEKYIDSFRRQAVLSIINLINSLMLHKKFDQIIDICLYALLHISMSSSNIDIPDDVTPKYFVEIAEKLYNNSKTKQAVLCINIFGFLSTRTKQISQDSIKKIKMTIFEPLKSEFISAIKSSKRKKWYPGIDSDDPWRYMFTENLKKS